MFNFTLLKNSPWAIILRAFALAIILFTTIFNIQWLPIQIHNLKQGRVYGIVFEIPGTSGKAVGDSATIEYRRISGEVVVYSADKEANENGLFAGDIVLNPEVLTAGEIGTSVTLLVKHGDLPVRKVELTRKPPLYSYIHTPSDLLGLSSFARIYLAIIFLCTAVLLTGLFGIVAFWFRSDAWLAFFVVGAITNFFTPLQLNPSWFLYWSYFPAGLILFLILFPNGRLNPKWSWVLVFLPLPNNVFYNVLLGRVSLPPSLSLGSIQTMFSRYGLTLFWVIAGVIIYLYREAFTPTERRRIAWLLLGMIFIANWNQWFVYFGASGQFIEYLSPLVLRLQGYYMDLYYPLLNNYIGVISSVLVLGIVVYRYHNTFTPIERQQIKWLVFGLAISMPFAIVLKIFNTYRYYLSFRQHNPFAMTGHVIDRVFLIAWLILALSVLLAILRYRLYDVDAFLNRALVYGSLIVIAGVICLSTIIFIDFTIGGNTQGNQKVFFIIPIAVFLIVVTFKPARFWLRKFADGWIKPERLNFAEAFPEFTPELRVYFTISNLSKILVTKSVEQLGVAYASLFIKNKDGKLQHIRTVSAVKKTPKPAINPQTLSELKKGEIIVPAVASAYSIMIPLVLPRGSKPDLIGALMLGPRLNGLGYSTEMKKDLKEYGKEVGKALYMAQVRKRNNFL